MTKRVRVLTTDAEIDAAIALAKLREPFRPKAISAEYRPKDDVVAIVLASGVELVIPRRLLQGLENATVEQASQVEILGPGSSLHWEALDVDHYVPSLIEGILGNRRWMSELGKRGGAVRSAAKTRAARRNGRKGGRPRTPADYGLELLEKIDARSSLDETEALRLATKERHRKNRGE